MLEGETVNSKYYCSRHLCGQLQFPTYIAFGASYSASFYCRGECVAIAAQYLSMTM